MTAPNTPNNVLSGRTLSAEIITNDLRPRVEALQAKGITPKLVVVLIGDHAASASYVRQKEKSAAKAGIVSEVWRYEETVTEAEILQVIEKINRDESIHGVIVQLPVPDHISVPAILKAIDPAKDVDGFTPDNVGKLFQGEECLACCTPQGIMHLVRASGVEVSGAHAVVVGRSNIVGKPVAGLLLNANATVTICHSRTRDLSHHTRQADILVVAVGRPNFVTAEHVREGAVVIDVGIHRTEAGKLTGDVDYDSVSPRAKCITPVPGGVGPMTVVSLIQNTIIAAERLAEGKASQ